MLSLGIIGMKKGRITENHWLIDAAQTPLLVGMTLDRMPALAGLSQLTISRGQRKIHLLDSRTNLPKFSNDIQWTDGRRLMGRPAYDFYAEALPDSQREDRDRLFSRFAPSWLNRSQTYVETDDPDVALNCIRRASAVPADDPGVYCYSTKEWITDWLACHWPERSVPAVLSIPRRAGRLDPNHYGLERYRTRARADGRVAKISRTCVSVDYGGGRDSHRRIPGLDWAVEPGQTVKAGQYLFDFRTLATGSPAHEALLEMWDRRMFIRTHTRTFVRLPFVRRIWMRCPLCLDILAGDTCAACQKRTGMPVRGLTAVADLRIEPGRYSCRYSGDPVKLQPVLPDLATLPPVLEYERRFHKSRQITPPSCRLLPDAKDRELEEAN